MTKNRNNTYKEKSQNIDKNGKLPNHDFFNRMEYSC